MSERIAEAVANTEAEPVLSRGDYWENISEPTQSTINHLPGGGGLCPVASCIEWTIVRMVNIVE